MTHNEFLTMMVNLECSINKLSKAIKTEFHDENFHKENGEFDVDRYMRANTIVSLAKSLTTTKLSIDYMHKMVYGEDF